MKTISLIVLSEDKNHITYYNGLLEMFSEFNIEFYTTQAIYGGIIKKSNTKFFIKTNKNTVRNFLRGEEGRISNSDIVILEQPYTNLLVLLEFIIKIKKPIFLTLHNINTWIFPTQIFDLKHWFFSSIRGLFVKNASGIIVVSPNLKRYVEELTSDKKRVFFFPFSNFKLKNSVLKTNTEGPINIIIPGMVDSKRRNYDLVLDAFKNHLLNGNNKLKLILLGKLGDDDSSIRIRVKSEDINSEFPDSVKFYSQFIPTKDFDQILESGDFLLSNLKTFYNHSRTPEIYGLTKETGISYAMIENELPCISPCDFVPINYCYNQLIQYRDIKELELVFSKINSSIIKSSDFREVCYCNKLKLIETINDNKVQFVNYLNSYE